MYTHLPPPPHTRPNKITTRQTQHQRADTALHLPSDAERAAFDVPCRGDVICISACYYAGDEVGLANKDPDMATHPVRKVIEVMGEKVSEDMGAKWRLVCVSLSVSLRLSLSGSVSLLSLSGSVSVWLSLSVSGSISV